MSGSTGLWPRRESGALPGDSREEEGEGRRPISPVLETKRDFISLVVPFYNEGEGVRFFTEAIVPIMEQIPGIGFEVVCVDDGSRDRTLELLLGVAGSDSRFRVVELSRNFGKEAALTAGIDAARGDAIIPIDADLQDPPELIPVLIEEWRKGAEMVLAYRSDRRSDTFMKRKTAELFYRIHNQLSNVKVPENVGDFRLMDRVVVDSLKQLPERQRFMKGLFTWVGFRTVSVSYVRKPRITGTTKLSPWKLWNFALEGITSFSTAPLRIWTYVGSIGALAAFFYGSFIAIRTIVFGVDVPGYASLLVSILFIGSLQLISVGVLGEYIGRIYIETKQRPTYIVRKVYQNPHESRRQM
ncbi:MAG: glycosyltransferase family 2 protein [Nitrospiraceae bacterium]|nr:glycosyltransferase family 2 protein [Nitrospiraceae bacterium]